MFLVGDVGVVVFVSDANSHGGSITNKMEELARESRREVTFKAPGGAEILIPSVRWFECRTGEVTKDGTAQSVSFDEVLFSGSGYTGVKWAPSRDNSARVVAEALRIDSVLAMLRAEAL